MALGTTAFYAGILGLWAIFLAFKVIFFRRGEKVSIGDGGSDDAAKLIRAHSNALEYIPLFLIMLGLAEGLGVWTILLHLLAIPFVIGRFMHGYHFMTPGSPITFRVWGMLATLISTIVLAIILILAAVF